MAKNNLKKQPAPNQSKLIKTPEVPTQVSYDAHHPIFSFEYLEADYCISKCETTEKARFADTLRILSTMTWRDIRQAGRHQAGYERIPRRKIRGHIPRRFTEDVEDFIAFRFADMKPMVGHKENQIFYVIWLDRDFTLYDHG